MTPADLQQLHEYTLKNAGFMRSVTSCAVIEDLRPELLHKLPPREPQHAGRIRRRQAAVHTARSFHWRTQHEIGGD
jgi:hypothetical protein